MPPEEIHEPFARSETPSQIFQENLSPLPVFLESTEPSIINTLHPQNILRPTAKRLSPSSKDGKKRNKIKKRKSRKKLKRRN